MNEGEEGFSLHIGDDFTEIKLPLTDDSCNGIYHKEAGNVEEWLIKPYGQPFMEIRVVIFEKESEPVEE